MKKLILKKNDLINVIAPASKSPANVIEEAKNFFEKKKYLPLIPENLIADELFVANTLEMQLASFMDALKSESSVIWCLRGGYGSMRLIPRLLKTKPFKQTKSFIGFSDITALHLFLTQRWNWQTIHGPNFGQMNAKTIKSQDKKLLMDILEGKKKSHTFKNLKALNPSAMKAKKINGKITGGNLRIVQSSIGTEWEIETKNKILFFEDIGERGYSIDRMLEQLGQAGKFNKTVKAIIFGDFTEGKEKDGQDLTQDAIEKFARSVSIPVFTRLKSGHGVINNPLPFNTDCQIEVKTNIFLHCKYP